MVFHVKMCQNVSFFIFSRNRWHEWQMVPFMRGIICQKRVLSVFKNLSELKHQPKLDMLPIVHTKTRSCTSKYVKMPFLTRFARFCTLLHIWETYGRYEKHERAQKTRKCCFLSFLVIFDVFWMTIFAWQFTHQMVFENHEKIAKKCQKWSKTRQKW